MKIYPDHDELIICLEGELTSVTAPEIGQQINEALAEHPGLVPAFDADKMMYISSAGLRMLLSLGQKYDKPLRVFNVSAEVYDIFEVTGFTNLLKVEKRMRQLSVEGCEVIGTGAFGTVYRLDVDTVVKVYRSPDLLPMIRNEQMRARQAFLRGIPTAIPFDIVRVGEQYGSVFEMVKARNCNERLIAEPEKIEEILDQYTGFIKAVHSVEMIPGELPDTRVVYTGYLDRVAGFLPEETVVRLRNLISAIPENHHVVHGDIQMKNVMLSDDEMILIDMDTLSMGDPVFELAGIFMPYIAFNEDDPEDAMKFLGISCDTCRKIYEGVVARYFANQEHRSSAANNKISLLGYLRFLYVVVSEYGAEEPLRRTQVARAVSRIQSLAESVRSLAL